MYNVFLGNKPVRSYFISKPNPVFYFGGNIIQYENFVRVGNIAIQVSISVVSAILFRYRPLYRRYFLNAVSIAISAILLDPNYVDIRYRYYTDNLQTYSPQLPKT